MFRHVSDEVIFLITCHDKSEISEQKLMCICIEFRQSAIVDNHVIGYNFKCSHGFVRFLENNFQYSDDINLHLVCLCLCSRSRVYAVLPRKRYFGLDSLAQCQGHNIDYHKFWKRIFAPAAILNCFSGIAESWM